MDDYFVATNFADDGAPVLCNLSVVKHKIHKNQFHCKSRNTTRRSKASAEGTSDLAHNKV